MRKIAITGNIASGKSTVSKILNDKGYPILNTDEVSHDILNNNQQIIEEFSKFNILDNNTISREKLGKIVFNDKNLLKKLENIIHPIIRGKIMEFFSKNSSSDIVFVEIPLLFEANMQDLFDEILFVYSNDKIRLDRLIQRNKFTEEYAKKRMNSQLSQDEKSAKSDIIINNNDSINTLKTQIDKYF